ncbi:hypothetical protein ACHAXR_009967, partial [Thalassiosira sp. AJA248-18]
GHGPNTWVRGKEAIDGIWVSRSLEIIGASYLPYHADLGDHRPVMVDITVQSLLGTNLKQFAPPAARRLNSKVKGIRPAYMDKLKKLFQRHNILGRLNDIAKVASYPLADEAAAALEAIDKLVASLMLEAEKGCRKIRANHYEFSPQVKIWLDRCHAYRQLIRYKIGKRVKNVANMKRFARRCNIANSLGLTLSQVVKDYKECKEHLRRLLGDPPWLRKQYLSSKLQQAIEEKNEESAARLQE